MRASYLLGLTFIFLVAVIWAGASILVQWLYRDMKFNSAFLLTYIGTSLFVILLPSRVLWERAQVLFWTCWTGNVEEGWKRAAVIPCRSGPLPGVKTPPTLLEQPSSPPCDGSSSGQSAESSYHDAMGVLQVSDDKVHNLELGNTSIDGSIEFIDDDDLFKPKFILGHYETFWLSIRIAPIWFIANYTYNLSLAYTTITSSTVLASTGSLFTFLFALACKQEKFTYSKCIGVVLCVSGSILTGLADVDNTVAQNGNKMLGALGDMAGLLSAILYGAYSTLIHVLCPSDESQISMQLLFGYIGLFNVITLSPFLLASLFQNPGLTFTIFGWLVVKGLFDNVLSDYLWARSVVLTSATVATVGLGLTIPLAFLSDWFISDIHPNTETLLGGLAVLVGFVLVNQGEMSS